MPRTPAFLALLAAVAGASSCTAESASAPTDPSAPGDRDGFGVAMLYPTAPGGRTWLLPADAEVASAEWQPETDAVTRVAAGVFETQGNGGEVRLNVHSPAGEAWWRNVEMTAYYRAVRTLASSADPHWELFARGERHNGLATTGDTISDGNAAPAGTAAWPGYPYGGADVNPRCLGTAYHGNVYLAGEAALEKEVSHSGGYAGQRGVVDLPAAPALGAWFGMKLVVRNADADQRVHLELWTDAGADGTWTLATTADDAGGWAALDPAIDGCGAAPFQYAADQLLTWAGPWVTFRSDAMVVDFKHLSVREIAPLP